MKLDMGKIRDTFAMLTDMEDAELPKWDSLCKNAGAVILSRLRENVCVKREMERLCIAAAAVAYCDYVLLSRGLAPSEARVGDISLKLADKTGDSLDAVNTRDHFLSQISDLILPDAGFAFTAAECPL